MEDEPKEETQTPPEPDKVVEKPVETAHHAQPDNDLRETVTALQAKVEELSNTVTTLLPTNQDEKPVKRPWTHRGSWR